MRIVTQAEAADCPLAYTIRSAELASGLSKDSLRRHAKEGRLRMLRLEGRVLVDGASLRNLIANAQPLAA